MPAVDIDLPAGISIHAPLTGSDEPGPAVILSIVVISIHAPLTGSDLDREKLSFAGGISIHAPLTGSDQMEPLRSLRFDISIHAPLTGSDRLSQLTSLIQSDFNPRSPYGERRAYRMPQVIRTVFQSTLPLRGATIIMSPRPPPRRISIHAPLTGSDSCPRMLLPVITDFNPRSPYGERPLNVPRSLQKRIFQSTLPLRGATYVVLKWGLGDIFQSTLPLRGATF